MEKEEGFICCICSKHSLGWGDKKQYGNNPQPIMEGQCCDECNEKEVIPRRIKEMNY